MATRITFTDRIGAAVLTNEKPVPADRFMNWTPVSVPIGEAAHRQSDNARTMFRFHDDFGARFELPHIPSIGTGSPKVASVDVADRLKAWLIEGGTCQIETGDIDANIYATCGLMPNTTPELELTDKQLLEYTLRLAVINVAASPSRMVCRYAQQ